MVRLSREIRFSVDRDWAGRVEFSRPVSNSWGGWPSAVGIVPFLRLRATVVGGPDPCTGYLCNIAVLDDLLRRHAVPHTAAALREHGWRMSAETLLRSLWRAVTANTPAAAALDELELCPTPFLRYRITRQDPEMLFLTQQFEFSASHRLHRPELSDEANRATFGKCSNPHGHGHNYLLEVTVAGTPEPPGSAVLPLPRFEALVKERVIDRLDHQHLNQDVPEFRNLNPTVENIARVIWHMLAAHLAPARLHSVRVWETAKTSAEYRGD